MSESDEDFASMFEASLQAKHVGRGQTIEGTIVAIGAEVAFVDVGGKGEALIEIAELKNDEGALEVAVGDRIQAVVTSTEGGLTLSRRLARGAATHKQLEDAFHSRLPVEGRIERDVKGGYEVRIGGQRAFCPFSQIDTVRTADPAQHVGRVYESRIVEYKEGGRNVVVSRRALLEEQQRAGAAGVRRLIVAGAVLTGASPRFASSAPSSTWVPACRACFTYRKWDGPECRTVAGGDARPGDHRRSAARRRHHAENRPRIEAAHRRSLDGRRVDLRGGPGPNRPCDAPDRFRGVCRARAGYRRIGARVHVRPDGSFEGWSRSVAVGMTAAFEILSIDLEKKRIGVALVEEGSTREAGASPPKSELVPGARVTGKVERHEKFGVFVFLAPGRTALMPLSETGMAREADIARAFPVGSDVEVVVLEADSSGRRIRVSRKAILDAREADEVREYAERADAVPAEGFGSLAEKLRGALKPRQK